VNDFSSEFEERLRRFKPTGVSPAMQEKVGRRLTSRPAPRDWPMLCAIGSGLAAACVILAMLAEQQPASRSSPTAVESLAAASSPHDPPAIYAFNSLHDSRLDDTWRFR
jgi:hypothetical protein